jgi:hypothetical protein
VLTDAALGGGVGAGDVGDAAFVTRHAHLEARVGVVGKRVLKVVLVRGGVARLASPGGNQLLAWRAERCNGQRKARIIERRNIGVFVSYRTIRIPLIQSCVF